MRLPTARLMDQLLPQRLSQICYTPDMFHTNDLAIGTNRFGDRFSRALRLWDRPAATLPPECCRPFFDCGHNARTSSRQCVRHQPRPPLDVIVHHLLERGPELVRWHESGRHRAARIDRRRRAEFFHTHSAHW
jgi:hypothetical protein